MANTIYSKVTIEPKEAMDKIVNMIESMPEAAYGKETKTIVETFYTEEEIKSPYGKGQTEYPISEEGVNISWLNEHVGAKWITIGIDWGSKSCFSPEEIRIESAHNPDKFLIKLYNMLSLEFENVVIDSTWVSEGESECGVVKIMNGIYAEDDTLLDSNTIWDSSYYVEGDEDIDDIKEWLADQDSEYLSEDKIEMMDEEDLRETFATWKNDEKWSEISNLWDNMKSSCEEAIETEDFDFPISKITIISVDVKAKN